MSFVYAPSVCCPMWCHVCVPPPAYCALSHVCHSDAPVLLHCTSSPQSFEGSTISEGGFAAGRVSSAAILDIAEADKDGKVC